MYFLGQFLLITIAILFAMHFVNAAEFQKASAVDSSEYDDEPISATTTMPIEVQKILAQIQDTKLVRNKSHLQELLKQMKIVYQSTTANSRCPFAKCNAKSM